MKRLIALSLCGMLMVGSSEIVFAEMDNEGKIESGVVSTGEMNTTTNSQLQPNTDGNKTKIVSANFLVYKNKKLIESLDFEKRIGEKIGKFEKYEDQIASIDALGKTFSKEEFEELEAVNIINQDVLIYLKEEVEVVESSSKLNILEITLDKKIKSFSVKPENINIIDKTLDKSIDVLQVVKLSDNVIGLNMIDEIQEGKEYEIIYKANFKEKSYIILETGPVLHQFVYKIKADSKIENEKIKPDKPNTEIPPKQDRKEDLPKEKEDKNLDSPKSEEQNKEEKDKPKVNEPKNNDNQDIPKLEKQKEETPKQEEAPKQKEAPKQDKNVDRSSEVSKGPSSSSKVSSSSKSSTTTSKEKQTNRVLVAFSDIKEKSKEDKNVDETDKNFVLKDTKTGKELKSFTVDFKNSTINGKKVILSKEENLNSNSQLFLRELFTEIGYKVSWNKIKRNIILVNDSIKKTVEINIDTNTIYIGDKQIALSKKLTNKSGKVMIKLDDITEIVQLLEENNK